MFRKNVAFGYGDFMFVFHCFNSSLCEHPFPIVATHISTILFNSHYFLNLWPMFFFHFLDGSKVVNIPRKILLTTLFQITFACVAIGHKCSNIMLQFDELFSKKGIYDIIFIFLKQCHLLTNFHLKKTLPTTMSPMQIHINSSPFW